MSIEIARYQFHSWVRKGMATGITEKDDLGTGTSSRKERATVNLPVLLNDTGITKKFELVGPGDIIGINKDMIVRTEPLNRITDFEPNLLAFAELYDDDFTTRYTPAFPDGQKLRPWIFLLVVKEDEFERTKRTVPLPSVTLKKNDVFPPANETWLWSHVHSDANIPHNEVSVFEEFLLSLNSAVVTDPDQLYSRLISPRRLEPNNAYTVFIIPAFETGRLAGLGQPVNNINTQMPSWSEAGARGEMPFYFEWSFRTGVNEDFESLVKRLEPRAMDPKVGIRSMDCQSPGFVKADGSFPFPAPSPGILGLEGALRSPDTVSTKFPEPVGEREFQSELEKIVNLPIDIIGTTVSGDPVISIPLYGGKHAKKETTAVMRLDIEKNSWLHDLNKDPRTRVPAGLGTLVIQKNQENFMRKAWAQVQNIVEANKRIKVTVLYMKVALQLTQKTFNQVESNVLLAISRPVLSRIMGSPTTIYQQLKDSSLPQAVFSGTFRRLVAHQRRFLKQSVGKKQFHYNKFVTQLNSGKITAAAPNKTPAGLTTIKDIAGKITTGHAAAEIFIDPRKRLDNIAAIPARPGFTLKIKGERASQPLAGHTDTDSREAARYRQALTAITKRIAEKAPDQVTMPFNISNAYLKVKKGIHPHTTFPKRLAGMLAFTGNIKLTEPEKILPVMAYPDFEEPMYKKLADISGELLLPNLQLIPPNTISLLKTNAKFIESYMVGLNHEMGRELLWREYPTDERGSYFRQFWDVNGIIAPGGTATDAEKNETYKDIVPIHKWQTNSLLGKHNNRSVQAAEQLVLLIRGDLLKKYPNTVIFAQKAIPGENPNETAINKELPDDDFAKNVKFPLYKAEINPDIKFFGFDLTIEQAKGTALTNGFTDHLGWYFILMQVPGAPSFGMDINFNQSGDEVSWDDLAWNSFSEEVKFIRGNTAPQINPSEPAGIVWGADSATMAYILFQKPNMVAVHAKQMLANLTT